MAALKRPTSCIHMFTMSTSVNARQNSADFPSNAFWSSFSRPSVPSTSRTSVWLPAARAHQIPLVVCERPRCESIMSKLVPNILLSSVDFPEDCPPMIETTWYLFASAPSPASWM